LGAQDLNLHPFQIQLGDKVATVSKAGIGQVAHVYKLSIDDHAYAFKVPNDPARMDIHGSYAETAAFTFLSNKKVSDLIQFHAANPSPTGGWMLTEFVAKPVQREGEPLAEILAMHELRLGDDWSANRGPGNVVWDLGGIEPTGVKCPTSLRELDELLENPHDGAIAARKLDGFTDQSVLKEALMHCLKYPRVGGQVARTAAQLLNNPADLHDVLSKALDTEGAAGRAAFELDGLAGTPYITDLFYKALSNPESRVEATKMIDKLPVADRGPAFNAAFLFPDDRAMAARSIPSLLESDRAEAIREAMEYPGSRYVVYKLRSKTQTLSATEREDMAIALKQYLQSYGLEMGATAHQAKLTAEHWLKMPQPMSQMLGSGTAKGKQ
jgi:hypothetical protein